MASVVEFAKFPSESLRVGKGFKLADVNPEATTGYSGAKADGESLLKDLDDKLAELQEKLFAESKFGGTKRVLLILQGMDTAGKGGIVKHVLGAMDPAGGAVQVLQGPYA
jgi:polyphosphate kinase 2 (PPK2 family)